jgi:hypothetical protein
MKFSTIKRATRLSRNVTALILGTVFVFGLFAILQRSDYNNEPIVKADLPIANFDSKYSKYDNNPSLLKADIKSIKDTAASSYALIPRKFNDGKE